MNLYSFVLHGSSSIMIIAMGFLSLKKQWNPKAGTIARFGELSTESQTYERSISRLNHLSDESRHLTQFSVIDKAAGATTLTDEQFAHVWDVLDWVVDEIEKKNTTSNINDFILYVRTHFGSNVVNFTAGKMVNGNDLWAPDFVNWEDQDGNAFTYWFADTEFKNQYQGGEVQVLGLMGNTSTWFLSKNKVTSELEKVTQTTIIQSITQTCIREDGTFANYTSLAPIVVRWYEKDNTDYYLDVEWTVAVYGNAKNNPEDIKAAIRNYLLTNPSYTEADWMGVFPEIFNPTEFTLIPMWAHYAVKPSEETAIYQPMLRLRDASTLADTVTVDYGIEHIEEHIEVLPNIKDSITLLSVSNPNNLLNAFSLSVKYPKYFLVASGSADYTRLNETAEEFTELLHTMLFYAKTVTSSSVLPTGLFRVYRHGRLFIVGKHGENTFMMLSRIGYLDNLGSINP